MELLFYFMSVVLLSVIVFMGVLHNSMIFMILGLVGSAVLIVFLVLWAEQKWIFKIKP